MLEKTKVPSPPKICINFTADIIAQMRDLVEGGQSDAQVSFAMGIPIEKLEGLYERFGIFRRKEMDIYDYATNFSVPDLKDVPTKEQAALFHLKVTDGIMNVCLNLWAEVSREVKYSRMSGDCRRLDPKRFFVKNFKELVDSTLKVIGDRKGLMEDLPDLDEQQNAELQIAEMVKRRQVEGKKEFQRMDLPPEGVSYSKEDNTNRGSAQAKKGAQEMLDNAPDYDDIEYILKDDDGQLLY